mmetsp:Transcript_49856/g.117908  ORF Transcript_49856/g.117908 Transcript_49856/m.117908 type:complete len:271 (+) Transcript_49856:212-1024(+)
MRAGAVASSSYTRLISRVSTLAAKEGGSAWRIPCTRSCRLASKRWAASRASVSSCGSSFPHRPRTQTSAAASGAAPTCTKTLGSRPMRNVFPWSVFRFSSSATNSGLSVRRAPCDSSMATATLCSNAYASSSGVAPYTSTASMSSGWARCEMRRSRAVVLPRPAARCSGVRRSRSPPAGLALFSRSVRSVDTSPFDAATHMAWAVSVARTWPPAASRMRCTDACPCLMASSSGVPPMRSKTFTSAPLSSRNCTAEICPSDAERWRAVRSS